MATTLREKLEAAGCKEVPKDHWIYSEGASTHFLPPTSQPSELKDSMSTTKTGNGSMAQQTTKITSLGNLLEYRQMTTALATQAQQWLAHRDKLIQSRQEMREESGLLLSDNPDNLVPDRLPEPLRSEVFRQLSLKPT